MSADPFGVFSTAREQSPQLFEAARSEGLPAGTETPKEPTVDRDGLARTLQAQISWNSLKVRWGGIQFDATIQDGQSTLTLEPGGNVPEGMITLMTSKQWFGGKFPTSDGEETEIEIQVPGPKPRWAKFNITAVAGQHDITDDQLTIAAEVIPADE